jgi:hypothetical protein
VILQLRSFEGSFGRYEGHCTYFVTYYAAPGDRRLAIGVVAHHSPRWLDSRAELFALEIAVATAPLVDHASLNLSFAYCPDMYSLDHQIDLAGTSSGIIYR